MSRGSGASPPAGAIIKAAEPQPSAWLSLAQPGLPKHGSHVEVAVASAALLLMLLLLLPLLP